MREIVVIAHDMRSTHNIGSLFRTAEGLGVSKLYLTGYTPHPALPDDPRLPHLADKLTKQINKTALGATKSLPWEYTEDITTVLRDLTESGYTVVALEQSASAVSIIDYEAPEKLAVVLGTEVTGLTPELLQNIPIHLVIPMFGRKESFNVVQAAAMAIFQFRFH